MTDLDELKRLLEQATPGPWSAEPVINHPPPIDDGWELLSHSQSEVIANAESGHAGDLLLIAALRNCAEELVRDARACAEIRRVIALGKDDGSVGRVARRAVAQDRPDVPEANFGNMAGGD